MSWLVAILEYLLRRVAHDMRVGLALHVVQRLHDSLPDKASGKALAPRRLAKLARLEDRLTRLVRAILLARMHVLSNCAEYIGVERTAFRRLATTHIEIRGRLARLIDILADVDASCRHLLRASPQNRARRLRTAAPRTTRTGDPLLASAGHRAIAQAAFAPHRALELSG